MNNWVPLIEDESLNCQKEKGNVFDLMLWRLFEETLSSDMSRKVYVSSFGNFFLCLTHQYMIKFWVKGSTAMLSMVSRFLSALFSKVM